MSEAATPETIDDYISRCPPEVQGALVKLRALIRSEVPAATEKISYRIPTFRLNGNLVHFAAFKNHIGFYPGSSDTAAFRDEYPQYKWSKGSVHFPLDEPLPAALIRKVVRLRVEENLSRAKNPRPRKPRSPEDVVADL